VLLPVPVAPTIRIRPRFSTTSCDSSGGMPSDSSVGSRTDAAEDGGDRPALLEGREAEAADARQADADVELSGVVQLLHLLGGTSSARSWRVCWMVSSWSDSCMIWPLILIRIGVLADM